MFPMTLADVKEKAKKLNINAGKMSKTELVRAIQIKEGNSACFQSEIAPVCGLLNCLWRKDCVPKN
jgi:hypothetical protein